MSIQQYSGIMVVYLFTIWYDQFLANDSDFWFQVFCIILKEVNWSTV